MALRFINESRSEVKTVHFDWWGAITLGAALSSLVLVLDQGAGWGWLSANSIICYVLMVIFTYVFIKIEHKSSEPIVDLKFFKIPAFVNTLMNNFIVFMGMMGGVFLLPIFAQTFLGYNATETGYLFMPMAFMMVIASPLGGSLSGKVKAKYIIFASTIVAAIGLFLFSFLDPRSGPLAIIIPLCIMAFGIGFGMAQRTNIIASVVKQSEIGIASSVLALVRNIAGAFGIALFGTILNNRIYHNVMQINSYSHLFSSSMIDLQKYIGLIILKAQVNAYDFVFIISSIVIGLGSFTILSLKVKEKSDVKVHVEA